MPKALKPKKKKIICLCNFGYNLQKDLYAEARSKQTAKSGK